MNRLETLIALALGTVLVAGCNPNRDATDADSTVDQTAPATTPSDMPPADTTPPTTDTMPPATDPSMPPSTTDPSMPPSSTDPTAEPAPTPDEEPPPSN